MFRYLYEPEHARKSDDEFRELCERTWFYRGDHERTIQARMGILREYMTEIREDAEGMKRKIKPLEYEPLEAAEMQAKLRGLAEAVERIDAHVREIKGGERGERGVAEGEGHREPDPGGEKAEAEGEREHRAEEGRDALAALEAEPDREEVPEEGEKAGKLRGVLAGDRAGDEDRGRALAAIEQERRGGGALVARPEHVRRADVARTDLAQVAEAHQAGEHHAEGDGAEQVSRKGEEGEEPGRGRELRHRPLRRPVCRRPR